MSGDNFHKPQVAVLGPIGTYTHEAAHMKFGVNADYVEHPTITDVLSSLSDTTPFAVVPQENSIFGMVIETYDALRSRTSGFVCSEVTLKVEHCLLVRKGVKLQEIRKVMSHEQALGQCKDFIANNLPYATVVKTPSTASAARALLSAPRNCAAICSKICATLFEDLEVLCEGIQRNKVNFTRFFIVAFDQNTPLPYLLTKHQEWRALLTLIIPPSESTDKKAQKSLLDFLNLLYLNIGRIDRRPSIDAIPFHDVYFVELQGEQLNKILDNSPAWISQVHQCVERLKCAGANVDLIGIW